jgi:hypothetical protein
MTPGPIDSLDGLGAAELVGLVHRLIGEVERLGRENEKLTAALAAAKHENQQLKDEIRRLKGLPPRPPMKPSGMEKATMVWRRRGRARRMRRRRAVAVPACRS